MEFTTNDKALEAKARRVAIKADLRAKKSRDRSLHANNHGGFMLIDPSNNTGIMGWNYELSAEEVLDYCRALLAERYKAERDERSREREGSLKLLRNLAEKGAIQ